MLETLFFYKVMNDDELNREAVKIVDEYKMGKLDPRSKIVGRSPRKKHT